MEVTQIIVLRKDVVYGSTALNVTELCTLTSKASIHGVLNLFAKLNCKTLENGLYEPGQEFTKYEILFNDDSIISSFLNKTNINYYIAQSPNEILTIKNNLKEKCIPYTIIGDNPNNPLCIASSPFDSEILKEITKKLKKYI